MKLSELGEDAFLQELAEKFGSKSRSVPIGIGDDAAAIEPPEGERILLATDALVEGTHFTPTSLPPRFVGRKVVAVNASDLAAMGGKGIGVLLSLVVTGDTDVGALRQLFEGVVERSRELGMVLLGGNLAQSGGPMVVDVTVVGHTIGGRALERGGAKAGDALYVSGKLGDAACGLKLLERGVALSPTGGLIVPKDLQEGPINLAESCIRAHMDPEPRLELGRLLNEKKVSTAAIDLSDGLAMDLPRLCRASGVGARVEERSLPLSAGVLSWEREWRHDVTSLALGGGEDYELLFAVRHEKRIASVRRTLDLPLTRIGELTPDEHEILLVRKDDSVEPLRAAGWDHFR